MKRGFNGKSNDRWSVFQHAMFDYWRVGRLKPWRDLTLIDPDIFLGWILDEKHRGEVLCVVAGDGDILPKY